MLPYSTSTTSNTSTTELEQQIGSGEKILWSGQPKRGLQFRATDVFFIPFSLFWAGFAIYWESSVISSGAPFFFMLWGIPFVCIGAYITVGRFFIDAAARAKTWYALTNQRIIILSGLTTRTVKSLSLQNLPALALEERRNGSGTITFGETIPAMSRYRGMGISRVNQSLPPAFELIADAKAVYESIRQAQQQA